MSDRHDELQGLIYGFCGIVIFSLTLPATRMALTGFDPTFVGLGRAIGVIFCIALGRKTQIKT